MEAISTQTEGQVIAIDGKTLRRSHDRVIGKEPIHMVSAWATENGVVWGQIKTDEKSNEIIAIPELLEMLMVEGCIITTDAMGCQKDIAEKIIEKQADYVLALKGNQKIFYKDVKAFLDDELKTGFKGTKYDHYRTVDKDHGRHEIRNYYITNEIEWLYGKENWKNLRSIGMAISERIINEERTEERRYFITSMEPEAERFGNAVRKHWGIESFHWVLDMTFREDYSRSRKDYEAENLAVARHMATNILKQDKNSKMSIEKKRYKCALDTEYLEKVIFGGRYE